MHCLNPISSLSTQTHHNFKKLKFFATKFRYPHLQNPLLLIRRLKMVTMDASCQRTSFMVSFKGLGRVAVKKTKKRETK